MSTLIHVKGAIKSGDKKRASKLIKTVLKENPSESAWFIAARLESKHSTRIKYLKQTLALNPEHKHARKLLDDIQRNQKPVYHRVFQQIMNTTFVQSLKQKYDDLTYRQHITFLGTSGFIVTLTIGLLLATVFSPKIIYLPDVNPFTYVQVSNTDRLLSHFSGHSLDLAWIEMQPVPGGIHSGQYIEFNIMDNNTVSYKAQFLVYKSYSALAHDINNIESFSDVQSLSANENTILIYPAELPTHLETRLLEAHQTMPTIDIHAREVS